MTEFVEGVCVGLFFMACFVAAVVVIATVIVGGRADRSYKTFTDLQRELKEKEMDEIELNTYRDGTVEKAVKCRILVNCPLDRSADRLVNHHGFVPWLLPSDYPRYDKEMTGTWSDIMTYAESLRGIEGIVAVELQFGDGPKTETVSPE